jgi:hypothetical protein
MYILDPDRGRRRRALARDKAVKTWNRSERYLEKVSRDLANRTRGLAQETKRAITGEKREQAHRRTAPDRVNAGWSPTTRVLAAALGGGIAVYGYKRGGLLGKAAATLGVGLLTRGVMNRSAPALGTGIIAKAGDRVASLVGERIEALTHSSESRSRRRAETDGNANLRGPLLSPAAGRA